MISVCSVIDFEWSSKCTLLKLTRHKFHFMSYINKCILITRYMTMEWSMNIVSFFAGAGGFDQGFKDAGFNIIWANDFNSKVRM